MRAKIFFRRVSFALAASALLIQLVPYGREHTVGATVAEPEWDSPLTRDLARRACFDCHSNETHWPWYSHVAPVSWLVQRHVDDGRAELNVSEWTRPQPEADESAECLLDGEMPPRSYVLLHPSARLTRTEREVLAGGLSATFGTSIETDDEDADDERVGRGNGTERRSGPASLAPPLR